MSKRIDHEQTKQMIEHWIAEAYRMYADAHRSIRRAKRVQVKLIEQSRNLECVYRIAPWVENNE